MKKFFILLTYFFILKYDVDVFGLEWPLYELYYQYHSHVHVPPMK